MIAVKFQSQNKNNVFGIPSYWPWKKLVITQDDVDSYSSDGWTVYSEADFNSYLANKKIKIDSYYMGLIEDKLKYLDVSIQKKKDFADDLISRNKKRNIQDGVTAVQGLWMHQRLRALPVTVAGMTFTIDILNMVISGDLELACISLMNTPPDDMTMPFHFLSRARISWLVVELKLFLGWP